jgi:hypothetical protein
MVFIVPGGGLACSFHNYLPDRTIVDRMVESEHIVLARPGPDNPFRYHAIEAIEGGVDDVDIPHLVDSASRRKFAANPADVALFARDGAYGPWVKLAHVDAAYAPVIDAVSRRLATWRLGSDGRDRFQFFAGLQAHPDAAVRRLALAELDRAPYAVLRGLEMTVDAKGLSRDLPRRTESGLLPIRVLLLGLSDSEDARVILSDGVERLAMRDSDPALGAYATALIELDPEGGIALVGRLLADDLSPDAAESLIEASAIHAEAGAKDTDALHAAVAAAVAARPSLALPVARQFGVRRDYSFAPLLDRLLRGGAFQSVPEVFAVSHYVALADAPPRGGDAGGG